MTPAVEPAHSKSRSRNLVFSPEHNLFILELSSTNNRPELWTYRYQKAGAPRRPPPPTNVALLTHPAKATLRWTPSSSSGVNEYRVYRAEPALPWLADFKRIGTTTGSRFEDKGVSAGKPYFYTVTAVADDGAESTPSLRIRAQPPVVPQPIVSVAGTNRVEINWAAHPAKDVASYNLYRGVASVKTVRKGEPGAWKDNDPEYSEPLVVKVTDITKITKLNAGPLRSTRYTDHVDLTQKGVEAADYKYAVYAYIIRAVNSLGAESGPSPYALTIPSEPTNFLCREDGDAAELKWDANPERAITGYRIYKLKGTWEILPVTTEPVHETRFTHKGGRNATRYWVVAVDALGQEGQPSSPAWCHQSYRGFYRGEWHQ